MNKEYRLLILGNFEHVYLIQFVKKLKEYNPNAHLFFWGYKREEYDADRSFLECYDEYYLFDINHYEGASVTEKARAIVQLRKHFRLFAADKYFDCIVVHYIKPEYYFLLPYFKEHASKLVLSPWGSDVYIKNRFYRFFVKKEIDAADAVTGNDDRFTRDVKRMFHVPDSKIAVCDLGVDPIEYIFDHKKGIDTNEAKRQLGIENHYVITCGYKAQNSHQHMKMIDAINKVKDQLPQNLLLLFPFTYPHNPEYIQEIKHKVEEYGLKAIYFEKFLDLPHLFLLRQATDMFIHAQTTDAFCGTLCEYLLCEKKVINGAWLQYPELIKNDVKPFFEVDDIDNLSQAILKAYQSEPIKIPHEVFDELAKRQWKVVIKDWDNLFSSSISHD